MIPMKTEGRLTLPTIKEYILETGKTKNTQTLSVAHTLNLKICAKDLLKHKR